LQVAVLFFNGVIDHILGTMEKINRFFDTWSKRAREVDEALWREAPGRLFWVIVASVAIIIVFTHLVPWPR
jgi:hypothetical protein